MIVQNQAKTFCHKAYEGKTYTVKFFREIDFQIFASRGFGVSRYVYPLYVLFYVAGLTYTFYNIRKNLQTFFKYPSIFTQREDDQGIFVHALSHTTHLIVSTFPKITVCSYQMHSRAKLQALYPKVNESVLKAFYGMPLNQELSYMKEAWNEFADIDLEQFYIDTMPDIIRVLYSDNKILLTSPVKMPHSEDKWDFDPTFLTNQTVFRKIFSFEYVAFIVKFLETKR